MDAKWMVNFQRDKLLKWLIFSTLFVSILSCSTSLRNLRRSKKAQISESDLDAAADMQTSKVKTLGELSTTPRITQKEYDTISAKMEKTGGVPEMYTSRTKSLDKLSRFAESSRQNQTDKTVIQNPNASSSTLKGPQYDNPEKQFKSKLITTLYPPDRAEGVTTSETASRRKRSASPVDSARSKKFESGNLAKQMNKSLQIGSKKGDPKLSPEVKYPVPEISGKSVYDEPISQVCKSEIYCDGEILHDVQTFQPRIYPDSKTFVDMKLKFSEKSILRNYRRAKANAGGKLNEKQMVEFINQNFEADRKVGWIPNDHTDKPKILDYIADEKLKEWASSLNDIWKELGLKVSEDVCKQPKLHSQLCLPHGFIIAGGRFTEMYYWDSFWIIKGLLLCNMEETSKGIMSNMLHLVSKLGFVPNGSRKYYTNRSQPPLLGHMAHHYQSVTKDHEFIRKNLELFEKEFNWWMDNRMVEVEKEGRKYKLATYKVDTTTPRPESYFEDYSNAVKLKPAERNQFYSHIKSAAESGWDFSTRYLISDSNPDEISYNLLDIKTSDLALVDLSSFLQANARILSGWFESFGQLRKARKYALISEELATAIEKVFWDEEEGTWNDYDIARKKNRKYFYGSNFTPLFTKSYPASMAEQVAAKTINYLKTNGILNEGGELNYLCVPVSNYKSGQQWDLPNCWPPWTHMILEGLVNTGVKEAQDIAFNIAQNWLRTNYQGFLTYGKMFEKYNILKLGENGEGGEYESQTGFGWTNGVVLALLKEYGNQLSADALLKRHLPGSREVLAA